MVKRKKLILTAIALMISFLFLGFGVYAASNPNISVTGKVSYLVTDAKVLVQGKVNGYKDTISGRQVANDYPAVNEIYTQSKTVNSQGRYLDFTENDEGGNTKEQLSTWAIGNLNFYQDNTGVKNISISLKLTNHSAYPVKATLSFSNTLNSNLNRTVSKTEYILVENGGNDEILIIYSVLNDATAINLASIAMEIEFVKYELQPTLTNWKKEYSSELNGLVLTGYTGSEKEIIVPSQLDGQQVVSLENTFLGNTVLENCIFMEGVSAIGSYVFSGCANLSKVILANTIKSINTLAFNNCKNLSSINLTNNIESIGLSAFSGCEKLESINIPTNLQTIENAVFSGCSSLKALNFSNNLISIGGSAFYKCSSLTSINFPESLKTIDWSAFSGCSNLASVSLPENLEIIGSYAFLGCSKLTSLNLPESLKEIGYEAFFGCSSLTAIHIPANVSYIGDGIINKCYLLTTITVDDNNTIYSDKNCNVIYKNETNTLVAASVNSLIPASTEQIGNDVFYCSNISQIVIPASVRYIGNYAFANCENLTSVVLNGTSVIELGYNTFYNSAKTQKIYVPDELFEEYYASSFWTDYKSSIQPISN